MSIEQKAKAYDEASKIARCWLNDPQTIQDCNYTIEDAIQNIFPQLRESEDERIRRTLVEYFGPQAQLDFIRGVPIQKIRDWLEKQKENPKNAISIPADCVSDAKCEDRWHKTANSLPDDGRDVLAKDALGNYLLASFDGAQWFVSVYDGEDHPVLHTPPILEWCEIPSEKQKEQKPAEWSERYIADVFENVGLAKIVREQGNDELTNAVQSAMIELSKGNKQEWSEDDEKMLELVIANYEYMFDKLRKGDDSDGIPDHIIIMDWLKSLRPSWKPSEEQIEAMEFVINDYRESGCIATANYLQEILDKIKKL